MTRFAPLIRFASALLIVALLGCNDGEVGLVATGGNDTDTTEVPVPAPADSNAPQAVSGLVVGYSPASNSVTVTWTAPWDDSLSEAVTSYEIRYAHTVGYPPVDFWHLAPVAADPPEPQSPGTEQQYQFTDPKRATDLYVGITSIDEAGNRSAQSDIVSVPIPGVDFAGRCVDVYTGLPLAGLRVTVTAGKWATLETDANGEFLATNVTPGALNVEIRTGAAGTDYHRLKQTFTIDDDASASFWMIPIQRLTLPAYEGISLLKLYRHMTNTDVGGRTVLAKWHERPVPCYIPSYVNSDGTDYGAEARRAAQRWMDASGFPLFEFVTEPPDTGIVLRYPSRSTMGTLIGITRHTRGDDGHPILDEIDVINEFADASKLYRVFLHEFGHTLSFDHVAERSYIMYVSAPLPPDIHPDEIQMVKLHESLPPRIDMKIYNQSLVP